MHALTIAALRQFPAQLERHFNDVAPRHWHWQPSSWDGVPSEQLDVVGQLCHLSDIELLGYHRRFEAIIKHTCPTLASIDSDALALQNDYAHADPHRALKEFAGARRQ